MQVGLWSHFATHVIACDSSVSVQSADGRILFLTDKEKSVDIIISVDIMLRFIKLGMA